MLYEDESYFIGISLATETDGGGNALTIVDSGDGVTTIGGWPATVLGHCTERNKDKVK